MAATVQDDPSDDSDDGSDDDDDDEEAATELSGDPLAEALAAEMANAMPSRSSSEPQSNHSTKGTTVILCVQYIPTLSNLSPLPCTFGSQAVTFPGQHSSRWSPPACSPTDVHNRSNMCPATSCSHSCVGHNTLHDPPSDWI